MADPCESLELFPGGRFDDGRDVDTLRRCLVVANDELAVFYSEDPSKGLPSVPVNHVERIVRDNRFNVRKGEGQGSVIGLELHAS